MTTRGTVQVTLLILTPAPCPLLAALARHLPCLSLSTSSVKWTDTSPAWVLKIKDSPGKGISIVPVI